MRGFEDAFVTTARTTSFQEFACLRFKAFLVSLTIAVGALQCRTSSRRWLLRRRTKWYKPWLHGYTQLWELLETVKTMALMLVYENAGIGKSER